MSLAALLSPHLSPVSILTVLLPSVMVAFVAMLKVIAVVAKYSLCKVIHSVTSL